MRLILQFKILLLLAAACITANLDAQNAYQETIRGKVTDKSSLMPLIGATVIIKDSDPLIGTTTDVYGNFRLEHLDVGRYSLQISFIGYHPAILNNLDLRSGKELVLNIELEEKVLTSEEVVIKAGIDKEKPLNEMATISARSFTVEETNRYAGSLGDPARMAANYAGVLTANDSRNDIIIRGNSPMGILWRLDGMEIPNPNHFGALGTTGGPVSILNNNLLDNSDFFTGAFPAEYGNALSGVFDLQMRTGNNEQREYTGQIGFNGFELGMEGPFSKDGNASYLASYRYSTLSVFKELGYDPGTGSSIPEYQDLTFKLDLPGTKLGRFSLLGIGGLSYINLNDSEKDSTEFSYGLNGTDTKFGSDIGFIGLSHLVFLNEKSRIKTHLSVSATRNYVDIDSIREDQSTFPYLRSDTREVKYSASTKYSVKFSAKNYLETGIIFDIYQINYLDSVLDSDVQIMKAYTKEKGSMEFIRAYLQWQHHFSDKLTLNSGAYAQQLFYNNSFSLEPRLGLKWKPDNGRTIGFGAGLHSQMQPRLVYVYQTELNDGTFIKTNEDLNFTKSLHLVLGYDQILSENWRIKLETYYQYIYDAPIHDYDDVDGSGQYSMLNTGDFFAIPRIDSLVNNGTGENTGVEVTLEKFFDKGYYFLLTTSLFNSKYTAYDGVQRNTSFNGNYVANLLGGYECKIGKHSMMTIDLKTVWAGGKRYTPIDIEKSFIEKETVYKYEQSYEKKYDDYFKMDLRIGFRINGKKINQEWALELKNISNHQNIFMQSYDPATNSITTDYQQGFFPMMLYRIQF